MQEMPLLGTHNLNKINYIIDHGESFNSLDATFDGLVAIYGSEHHVCPDG